MDFNEDGRRQARLYEAEGAPHGYGDMRETTPNDLAVAATAKARRQRIIGIAIMLVVLAALAAYLIIHILSQ
jgi:hypothetical protein